MGWTSQLRRRDGSGRPAPGTPPRRAAGPARPGRLPGMSPSLGFRARLPPSPDGRPGAGGCSRRQHW
ncbi:MAG: hypothetical protein FJ381_08885 [Verrucomicrobia bacterium]|nr:hypothetical protein [Verrucomicrobiota bacterium]